MKGERISPRAVRTATKMTKTIFDHSRVSSKDSDRLLNLITTVAIQDLAGAAFRWTKPIRRQVALQFGKSGVVLTGRFEGNQISATPGEEEVEQAALDAEAICDQYQLDEEERNTLYTSLPCLALAALHEFVEWEKPPPFPEAGW